MSQLSLKCRFALAYKVEGHQHRPNGRTRKPVGHAREVSLLGRFNRVDNWARSTVEDKGSCWGMPSTSRMGSWRAHSLASRVRCSPRQRSWRPCSRSSTLHSPRLKAVMSPASHFGPRTACSRPPTLPPWRLRLTSSSTRHAKVLASMQSQRSRLSMPRTSPRTNAGQSSVLRLLLWGCGACCSAGCLPTERAARSTCMRPFPVPMALSTGPRR